MFYIACILSALLCSASKTAPSQGEEHKKFILNFPGGRDAYKAELLKRANWNPLESFENASQPDAIGHTRFDALGPVLQCPNNILNSFGKGDGEKRVCGNMDGNHCVVISIGSRNEWDFEEAVIAKYPSCRIHTLDCYVEEAFVPAAIKGQVTFHPYCLGLTDVTMADGKRFLGWPSLAKMVGLTHPPTVLKMDIEGFEWTTIPAIIKSGTFAPLSYSFELHLETFGHKRSGPEIALFIEVLYSFGYALVDRHDNPFCGSCSELVVAKVLPGVLSILF